MSKNIFDYFTRVNFKENDLEDILKIISKLYKFSSNSQEKFTNTVRKTLYKRPEQVYTII